MTFWGPRMDQEPDLYDEPPQEWHECPACDGNGYTVHRVSVYENGCGFPHDDSEERPCERCNGQGGWIDDKQSDTREPCPYRHFTEEEDAAWARVFEPNLRLHRNDAVGRWEVWRGQELISTHSSAGDAESVHTSLNQTSRDGR